MTVTLPLEPQRPPEFRVLYRARFDAPEGSGEAAAQRSGASWSIFSQPVLAEFEPGYELLKVRRVALPQIGTASFRYVYGNLATGVVPAPLDLKNKEVRLQLRPAGSEDEGDWTTVFWGHVDYQEDQAYAGAAGPAGVRVYNCVDGFARTAKWMMNRHGYDGGGTVRADCYGNPGYNWQASGDGPVIGNRSESTYHRGAGVLFAHRWQGAFSIAGGEVVDTAWTELQAIEHALAACRPDGQPLFKLATSNADNWQSTTPISTGPGETVFDFVARVTSKRRGRGAVYVSWSDEGDPNGPLYVFLEDVPLFYADETGPQGAVVTGAESTGKVYENPLTSTEVWDLEGDHRNVDSYFQFTDAEMQRHDYVEVVGERIEVGVTLSYADTGPVASIYVPGDNSSLAPRWGASDVSAFSTIPSERKRLEYWDFLWQAHGLPRLWAGAAGGASGSSERVDYRCDDDGDVVMPSASDKDTSAPMTEILGSLPIFHGYDYSVNPPRKTDSAPEYGAPARRTAQVYLRVSDDPAEDRWVMPAGALPDLVWNKFANRQNWTMFQPMLTIHPDAILCIFPDATSRGLRPYSDTSDALLVQEAGAIYDVTRLAFSVTLRLPHRVRFCAASPDVPLKAAGFADWTKAKRKKTLVVPGAHLWMAAPKMIWDLNQADLTDNGYKARRHAGEGAYLRDDRARLATYFLIAKLWYMEDRRRVKVGQRFCGLLPWAAGIDGSDEGRSPQIGEYLKSVRFNGTTWDVGTPVTDVLYDHQKGETTWMTDWSDLDFGSL